MAIKCVIGDPKTGKTKQFELESGDALKGKAIGDTVTIDLPELAGYELEITGGSDSAGFPMRSDVDVPKRRILAVEGVGIKKSRAGRRTRKMVAGRMVTVETAQLNLKILKHGKQSLWEEPKAQEPEATASPAGDAKEEKPAEDKKAEGEKS